VQEEVNLSSAVASSDLGSDAAQVGYSSADGLLLMGQGSTNDVSLINDTGTVVARIPTGLSQFLVSGSFQVDGSSGGRAYLTTSETTVVADDSLGALEWYAPSEASGTDSIAKSGAIECVAEAEFTATANPTKMEFKLGVSEAATSKMTLSSGGDLSVTGTTTVAGQNASHKTSSLVFSQESSTKSQIRAYGADASTAGQLEIVLSANDGNPSINNSVLFTGSETVFNDGSADVDFRVESDGNANMLCVDAGNDKVGVGTNSPSGIFDVTSSANVEPTANITGDGFGYTHGAIALKSSTGNDPHVRGQGIYLFNEGNDTTWYLGTSYQNTSAGSRPFDFNFKTSTTSLSTVTAHTDNTKLRIQADGTISAPSGIELGSGLDNTDANTLDDYEEGTFTGTLGGYYSSPTSAVTATGYYTKVGRSVHFGIDFGTIDTSGGSGDMWMSGLPFTSCCYYSIGGVQMNSSGTFPDSAPFNLVSGNIAYFYKHVSNGNATAVFHNAGTGRGLRLSNTYITTA